MMKGCLSPYVSVSRKKENKHNTSTTARVGRKRVSETERLRRGVSERAANSAWKRARDVRPSLSFCSVQFAGNAAATAVLAGPAAVAVAVLVAAELATLARAGFSVVVAAAAGVVATGVVLAAGVVLIDIDAGALVAALVLALEAVDRSRPGGTTTPRCRGIYMASNQSRFSTRRKQRLCVCVCVCVCISVCVCLCVCVSQTWGDKGMLPWRHSLW
jgi:hypothetical protein